MRESLLVSRIARLVVERDEALAENERLRDIERAAAVTTGGVTNNGNVKLLVARGTIKELKTEIERLQAVADAARAVERSTSHGDFCKAIHYPCSEDACNCGLTALRQALAALRQGQLPAFPKGADE